MTPGNDEHLAAQIRGRGLRVTGQRLAVARCLLAADEHLTAEGVLSKLRQRGCRCSRATVYNALNDFCRHGLVQPVVVDTVGTYFDPVTEPHPHLYLPDTGRLVDLPPSALPAAGDLDLPPGLKVESDSLVVRARPAGRAAT